MYGYLRVGKGQELHKFAYLTMKISSFARCAPAMFIFLHSASVLVLQWMICFAVSNWQKNINSFSIPPGRPYQFNSRIAGVCLVTQTIWNIEKWRHAETRSSIFRWHSHCLRRQRPCLSFLVTDTVPQHRWVAVRLESTASPCLSFASLLFSFCSQGVRRAWRGNLENGDQRR